MSSRGIVACAIASSSLSRFTSSQRFCAVKTSLIIKFPPPTNLPHQHVSGFQVQHVTPGGIPATAASLQAFEHLAAQVLVPLAIGTTAIAVAGDAVGRQRPSPIDAAGDQRRSLLGQGCARLRQASPQNPQGTYEALREPAQLLPPALDRACLQVSVSQILPGYWWTE